MADDRTYIKLHDGMPDHPKIDPLSDGAFRLVISGWCWCSRHLTDGVMPQKTWLKRGKPKARQELVTAGLVELLPGGDVQWHDYLEHQRSAAQVVAMKEQRRAAGRNGGLAKGKRPAKQTASDLLSEMPSKTEAETEGSSIEEPQAEGSSGRKRPAKGRMTGPPDVFPITEAMAEWGRANAPLVTDPQAETRQFLDHARANGKAFIDWTAAWRTWMSNAQKYATQRPSNIRAIGSKQMPPGTNPHLAHLYEQS